MPYFRFVILFLVVMCTTVAYINRVNFPITIVSMVLPASGEPNATQGSDQSQGFDYCPNILRNQVNDTQQPTGKGPKYDWSPKQQGIVLGLFTLTYVGLQVPAGLLAQIVNPKWIMLVRFAVLVIRVFDGYCCSVLVRNWRLDGHEYADTAGCAFARCAKSCAAHIGRISVRRVSRVLRYGCITIEPVKYTIK